MKKWILCTRKPADRIFVASQLCYNLTTHASSRMSCDSESDADN